MDLFKQTTIKGKGAVFLVLTDEQDPNLWSQIIAQQFKEQTGISIEYLIKQKTLGRFLGNANK